MDIDRRVSASRCYQVGRDGVKGDSLGRCHALVPVASVTLMPATLTCVDGDADVNMYLHPHLHMSGLLALPL